MCEALACVGGVLWTGFLFPDVTNWLSGHTGSNVVALWLTLLPDGGSRGRFGDGGVSVSMSVFRDHVGRPKGRKGAARASAGDCSMLIQK